MSVWVHRYQCMLSNVAKAGHVLRLRTSASDGRRFRTMGWFRPGCGAVAARRSGMGCEVALIGATLSTAGLDGQHGLVRTSLTRLSPSSFPREGRSVRVSRLGCMRDSHSLERTVAWARWPRSCRRRGCVSMTSAMDNVGRQSKQERREADTLSELVGGRRRAQGQLRVSLDAYSTSLASVCSLI